MAPSIAPKTLRSPSPDTLPDIRYEKDTTAAGKDFFPRNKLITDFADVPAYSKNLHAFQSLQGFKLKDIRNLHVLIVENVKYVAECIQFAHSFTGSELKTNCRHGRGLLGKPRQAKDPLFLVEITGIIGR
ncbi:hypothetical protein AM232_11380 [Bacillus sp. FJAT-21352]|nr:hypothetical protein AM232_11380 [Bacillus sp. FJAT-21352]